jgi:hypothetical protein
MDVNVILKIISDNYFSFSEISMSEHIIENATVFSTEDTSNTSTNNTDSSVKESIGKIKSLASDILSTISILQDALVDIYFNYDCCKYKYRFAYYLKQLPRWKHLIETGIPTPKNYPGNSASDYKITPIIDFDTQYRSDCMDWYLDVRPVLDRMKSNLDNLRTWLFDPARSWYRSESKIADNNCRESYYVMQRLKLEHIMIHEMVDDDVDHHDYLSQMEGLPLHLIKPPEYYGFPPVYIPPSEAKPDGPRFGTPRYNSRNIDTQGPPDCFTRPFCRGRRADDVNSETATDKKSSCERPPHDPFSRQEDVRYRSNYIPYEPPRFLLGGVRQSGSSSTRNSASSRFGFRTSAQKYGSMKPDEKKKENAEKKSDETKPSENKQVPKLAVNNTRFGSLSDSDEE